MRALAAAAFVVLASVPVHAQTSRNLRPRTVLPKSFDVSVLPGSDLGRVVLKIRDDAGARVVSGDLAASAGGLDVSAVAAILAAVPGATVEPLIPVQEDVLDDLRRRGERNTGEELADLTQLFVVRVPAGTDTPVLVADLLERPEVENAYCPPTPGVAGDFVPCATPDFSPQQGYRYPAPAGVGAFLAESLVGGTGSGVTILDIEFAWNLSHEDLQVEGPGALLGPTWFPATTNTDHGTAVVGVLSADRDGSFQPPGVIGVAHGADLKVVPIQTSTAGPNTAAAIVFATLNLQSGDEILIELHQSGPNWDGITQFGYLPMEYFDAEFYAIRQATAVGIHVVEAGGNGSQDFDSLDASAGVGAAVGHPSYDRLQPYHANYRHSGAKIVGAASDFVPHVRLGFSNHGDRVDAYSWGQNVMTLGYGPVQPAGGADPFPCLVGGLPDPNQFYTGEFNGTSSASPIVGGAAAILESTHRAYHGGIYLPEALRMLLRTSGTASATPATDRIGRQPDLKDQMEAVQIGPQLAHLFTGPSGQFYPRYGEIVESAGDVNGDATPDILVASRYVDVGGLTDAGQVDVWCGRTGLLLRRWQGTTLNERVGYDASGAGDVDLDGLDDVIFSDDVGLGNVYVYSVMSGTLIHSYFGTTGQFGQCLTNAGSIDGDPWADIVVSSSSGGLYGHGYVKAWSGASGWPMYTIDYQGFGEFFSADLAGVGDVDGDGSDDFAVSAVHYDGAAGVDTGRILVYSGPTGSLLMTIEGEAAGDKLGESLSFAGDLDGDGRADILAGARYNDAGGTDTGRAYVFSGATGGALLTITGGPPDVQLGIQVADLGDWNKDGTLDYAVSTPGGVTVRSGSDGSVLSSYQAVFGLPTYWDIGTSIAGAGDLNGDGRPDLLAGASLAPDPTSTDSVGRACAFLSPPPVGAPLPPSLLADLPSISAAAGGSVLLEITAGTAQAGKAFGLGASVFGSSPGTALPGGLVAPINPPYFLTLTGLLDASGRATVQVGPYPPGALGAFVGGTATFAAITLDYAFVSVPATITVIP